jgi:hypothetical protein
VTEPFRAVLAFLNLKTNPVLFSSNPVKKRKGRPVRLTIQKGKKAKKRQKKSKVITTSNLANINITDILV